MLTVPTPWVSSIVITGQCFFSHANTKQLAQKGNDLCASYIICHVLRLRGVKGRLVMLGVPTPRRRWLFACHFAVPPRPSYVRMDYTPMRSAMTVQLMKDFGNSSELGPNSQINLKVQAIVRAQAVGLRVPSSGQRRVTKHRHDEPGTKESLEKAMNIGRIDIESEATKGMGW